MGLLTLLILPGFRRRRGLHGLWAERTGRIWQVRAVTSAMLDGDEEIGGRTGEGVPCLIVFAAALT